MPDTIIRLNVGGRVFETTEGTLMFDGVPNFFTGLLSDRTPSLKDAAGAYFIDRDPDYFSTILRFMRTRKVELPPHCSVPALQAEAMYYSIDSLAAQLEAMEAPEPIVMEECEPLRNGAYINHDNTRAVLFTNTTNIMLVEGSAGLNDLCDAYTQARVARTAIKMPTVWSEKDRCQVDYAAFFCNYIKRGKYEMRHEHGSTFLSLVVPGENLTRTVMAVLLNHSEELLMYSHEICPSGSFVRYQFKSF